MFYSSKPQELRDFFKDILGLEAYDSGGGWLIFDIPEADMGVHPSDEAKIYGSPSGTPDISFYCGHSRTRRKFVPTSPVQILYRQTVR